MAGLLQHTDVAVSATTATELDEILFSNVRNCEYLGSLMAQQRQTITGGTAFAASTCPLPSRSPHCPIARPHRATIPAKMAVCRCLGKERKG